ncbi:Crp/Fnr family transcriptional regulator [bacterium SCSIO 12643]|nr:Crp/Fnr family transcriptional regulator [bacterium SCSIO 12643]
MRSISDLLNDPSDHTALLFDAFKEHIKIKVVPKGTILQYQGDQSGTGYYVKKGLLKSYIIDEKGKEHIFMFAPEKWIISDIESQIFDIPSELFIETLEDSEIYVLKKELLNQSLLPDHLVKSEVIRLLKRISVLQKRVIMLMSAPAIKRFEHFMETYPDIIHRVPQKMIASYLGITPEALSKIKSDQFKKP